ncbi:MAG TPA: hypothetical protein VLV81_11275 [Acidimicrobiia bacterium]|nr:hypothetical protein [Acidimicrobiia bacterium]
MADAGFEGLADVVETLRGVEERLRDAAYERLRDAVEGDEAAVTDERRLQQARRAVERALRALGAEPEL